MSNARDLSRVVNVEGAEKVGYLPAGTGAVATDVQSKLRESVSVKDFGAVGDGVTNDTDAFAAASAYINAHGGGKLVIPSGTYIVGKQTFAGATGKGYAYQAADIIRIQNCTNPVIIEGNGAVLKIASGLKFGSFDPVTGAVHNPTLPFYNADYSAQLGAIISVVGCKSIMISDLELDGNINNQIIGGEYGDSGRQLGARGISEGENDNVVVRNVYTHHHGLDGIETMHTAVSSTTTIYPHTYINCRSTYNGRQGISWVGGNHLTMIGCDLSHTGKNGVVASAPGAGIDIEPEGGNVGKNGTFINCRFYDNSGVGVLASTGPSSDCSFYNCQIIGTTQYSGWVTYPRYRFHDCTIVGEWVHPGGDTDPEDAAKWFGCKFIMDTAASPSGVIFGSRMNFDGSFNVLFEGCVFYAASGYTLPYSIAGEDGTIYSNCTFEQAGAGSFYTRGNFIGHCRITHSGFWDRTGSILLGSIYANGTRQTVNLPTTSILNDLLVGTASGANSRITKSVAEAAATLLLIDNGAAGSLRIDAVAAEGWNAGASAVKVGRNSTTSRAINAGGTVNASGADYAEYERNNGLDIPKGSIVGFKADGTLTLTFSEAVRFGVKSTDPSYVGGDTWGSEDAVGKRPEQEEGQTVEEFSQALGEWETRLEAERIKVDRIAYSGKVPVNVQGAAPGGYIVATEGQGGSIVGEFIADPDFAQYKKSVGRVNRILGDGRAEVAVMVH